MKLKVRGVSQLGKQRIFDYGDTWNINKETKESYMCSGNDGKYLRWVDKINDRDFEIIELLN